MRLHGSFGLWLKQRRKSLDLTQADLADQVGCSTTTIRKIEADQRRPSKHDKEKSREKKHFYLLNIAIFWFIKRFRYRIK